MNRKITSRLVAVVPLLLLLAVAVAPRPARAVITCQVRPEKVDINLGYHGATLVVTGESTVGDDILVRISSPAGAAHYKYIGKAGGLFWMKKGDVTFTNVPGVYLLETTRKIEAMLTPAARRANLLGYDAIKAAAGIETESEELTASPERWKDQLVSFKEKQKLYAINTGSVKLRRDNGRISYRVEVAWPFQAPPGSYRVDALAIKDGRVADQASASFTVARTGVVAQIADLAFNRSALYGIMAVAIAIVAGFAVGMVFKGGGAH